MSANEDAAVHPQVRKSAAWVWRLLVLLAGAIALLWLVKYFAVIFVPLALAMVLAALLLPGVDWLERSGIGRVGAVILMMMTGLGLFGGILTFVVARLIDGLPVLLDQLTGSVNALRTWLTEGPLNLDRGQIDSFVNSAIERMREQQSQLTTEVVSTATTITEVVAGMFIVAFALVSFLYSGRKIFHFVTQVFAPSVREKVRTAGKAGFGALTGYVRGAFIVALVDAVGIGAGLVIMGIPLALALASLVFLGAFIPFVGAVVTGFLAVMVALLAKGWVYALIVLGLVVAVQQLEGNVLQPLVMGRAVAIHPLAVLLGLTAGAVIGGIAGVLLAVPVLAFMDHAIRSLLEQSEPRVDDASAEPRTGAPP